MYVGCLIMKSKLFFIGLIVLILLSVSCVSANQDDTVLANDNDNILALDEDDIQVQANEGENEALSAEKGSYSELEQAFLDNDIFNFEKDYEAGSGDGVINIKKSIEINGKGHSIDAKGYAGIFQADSSESDNIDITIKNLIFKNGKRDFGGAIFVDGADNVRLTLINCTFIKNQANEDGGAIYFDSSGGELVIVDSAFNKNEGLFSANHKSNGGTINVQDADLFTIDGSYFKDSHAYGHGGAIYSNVILSIDRSNFEGNDAVGKGGMLYLNGNHNFLNVTNSRFYKNGATNDGGVFFIDDTVDTIQLKDCNFTYNLASGYDVVTSGGVIFNNGGGTIYAINSNFTENRAIFTGVFIFSEVVYDFRGGAIYTGADMYISGCEFINNTASNKGGSVYAGGSILWGDPSVFKENYVSESYSYHGGAVYAGTFANTAKGLIFINNKAGYGGAVYINNKNEATFESCYFENNRANDTTEGKSRGAAIYLDSSSSKLSLINNIFVNNEATSDKAVYNCGSYATVEENWWGVNNPNFDEPYLVEWHRIGDDTKHSDSSPLSIVLTADNNLTNLGESARLTLKFVDANGADITGKLINWDVAFSSDKIARFEEKNVGDNKATVVFTPIETGTHTITAQVNNQKVSITIDINGEFNYLQYLIDNAEGALVLERDFTYSLGIDNITEGVLINKTFVIDGQGHTINALGQSRIFNIASDNVIISNITLLNGLADYGGAVLVDHTSGNIFMDCNFTNNKANNYGGAIHTTGGDAPHIVNCNFNDNTANIGGAITLDAPNSIVSQSNFSNNSAVQGGAIYGLRSFIRVDECEFNSNSADYGGAIYFKFNNCTVSYSNFENNVASETGGAIMIEGRNASIVNSRFMSNKAKASEIISNTTDALILTLIGSENYINAITSPNPVTFANVTYWNGRMTNDDPVDSFNVAGLDITIEIYNGDVLVKNMTLMTNLSGQVNYNYYELDDGNYTFNAYHADSSFYTRVSTTGKFNFTRPNSLSSVTINLTDGKEFQYGECNISFEIINRTDVRVVISNQDGSEIYFDQNTDLNYVMPRLNAKEEYYNITVYNLGDKDHSPSKDSKLFKINKNNSTVVINPIEGVYYGDNITISYNGFADLYLVGIFINGTDTSVFFKQTSENSVTVGNLDSGVYEVIVMALGDNIAESSRNSTIFQVKVKETNTFNVTVGEVTYGENATITVRAKIDGVYAVDINSTIIEVNVTGGIGSASIMLGAGSYYANVTSNNTNYIANSTNTTFTVDKARSIVFINEDSFANIQPDKEFIVFINDPYPTTYNVTLYDEADHINYTAIISSTSFTLPGLELGDYNLTVTNLGNENVTGSSYSFIFDVTNKNNVKITVDDADYGKDLLIFIYAHADGFYYVYINGTEVIIEVKNGFGSYDGDLKLAAGDYYANVTYGNPFYETIAENTTFTIYKSESNIRITGLGNIGKGNALQFYDDYPTIFNVTIKDKEGNVVLNQLTDAMSVDLSILDVGQYTANITNIGNENVSSDSASIIFTVYDLSVDVDGKIVTVSVADNATGNVTLKIDNKTFTKELENGSAIFQLGNVTSGYHNATISYAGDDNYEGISKEMTVLVGKLSIIASDAKYGLANQVTYSAKIVDEEGNPVNDIEVTFIVDGKTYTAKSNAEGVAKITLKLNVGTYSVKISTVNGDNVNKKITVVERLSQSNLVMYYLDGSTFNAKVVGDNGQPASGQTVVMKLNGVTFKVKTDKNGIAKLRIKLKPKTHVITSTYNGKTLKNTIKVKQVLKLKKVKVKRSAKKLVLTATLKHGKKPIKGKKLTFKFKGKKYRAKTNKKGVAKVTIKKSVLKKLKVGKKVKYQVRYVNAYITKTAKVKR